MGKSLVIVESPSKATIINRYLGDDYVVKASVGHIRDLSAETTKNKSTEKKGTKKSTKEETLVRNMGVDPKHGWKANYQIMPDKVKVVSELRKLAKDADTVQPILTVRERPLPGTLWRFWEAARIST